MLIYSGNKYNPESTRKDFLVAAQNHPGMIFITDVLFKRSFYH